jgi:ABC-2 type transport system ATP-binding protein
MASIEIRDFSKWYGEVIGVSNINARIDPGVTGLLGPNGAGKSTLLKLLTGQIKADTGEAKIGGQPVWNNPPLYDLIGFCPDLEKFYERLTGLEFLSYAARLHGMSKAEAISRSTAMLEKMGLADAIHKRIGAYSKGMRQRIKFAQAVLHEPDVIFLDEPLSGMDPIGRHDAVEMIREFSRQGKTILVSSHILHEVEEMTSRILVLNNGLLLAEGEVQEIRELIDEQPRHVRIITGERQQLTSLLVNYPEVQSIRFCEEPDELVVQTTSPDAFYNRMDSVVFDHRIPIHQIIPLDDNLQSVFEYLVKSK